MGNKSIPNSYSYQKEVEFWKEAFNSKISKSFNGRFPI